MSDADTRKKRESAVAVDPVSPVLPAPDGSIDEGDRRQLAQSFRFDLGGDSSGDSVTLNMNIVVQILDQRRRRRA